MTPIVSIHSYRGGTGKSNVTANLACLAALAGRRVAVFDTDLRSPGVHLIFGLTEDRVVHTINDFLFGRCELEQAAYDMTSQLNVGENNGAVFLLPSRMQIDAIMKLIGGGYDVAKLGDQFGKITRQLNLDLLLIDTHPGLNRESLLTTAVSTTLLILLRPDNQDYHGTAVLSEVANRLGVPEVYMLANKVVGRNDPEEVKARIKEAYGHDVLGVLKLNSEMAALGSSGVFISDYPDHAVSNTLRQVLGRLLESSSPSAS